MGLGSHYGIASAARKPYRKDYGIASAARKPYRKDYGIALASAARKPHRKGLPFTQKNSDFGVTSVTERRVTYR